MHDDSLPALVETLDPKARHDFRRVLIDRDVIASHWICELFGWPQPFVQASKQTRSGR
jgi:hypothetical protein